MSIVRFYNSRVFLTTLLVLVLSSLACAAPAWAAAPAVTTTPTTVFTTATIKPSATPDNTPGWTTTVAQAVVNVRAVPNGAVIGSLVAGDAVTILECVGDWCKIEKPAGYVWRGCLSDNPDGLGCQAK